MKILVTGATGYIGGAAARALQSAGHIVQGLARSDDAADRLARSGFEPVRGDFADHASLAAAAGGAEMVVSTASVGSLAGDPDSFIRDREAVRAMLSAIEGSGKGFMFTSGSAMLGIFADGEASSAVLDEATPVPLPPAIFAPEGSNLPDPLIQAFGAAMAARVGTEHDVLSTPGIRGMVMRPGLVYGDGGSYDIPGLIDMAGKRGAGVHLGVGDTLQGYVHIDDLADLYRLAADSAPHGTIIHGVTAEVSQRDLAAAISRLIGAGNRTDSLDLMGMFELGGPIGISASLNKRLDAARTQALLGWSPIRTDILEDVATGSYAARPSSPDRSSR